MDTAERLLERRKQVLEEIAALGPMRRGSITEQFVETVDKRGRKSRRGPYPVYSFKDKAKTVSRRLKGRAETKAYREQIDAFREYRSLSAELVRIGQRLADVSVSAGADEKKTSRRR